MRLLLLILFLCVPQPLAAMTTKATQAILIDAQTGQVLFEKNADVLIPATSLTKIATVMLIFRALDQQHLREDDLLPVSKLAWSKTGSRMFLEVGTMVRVKDLLKGVAVQSANDAAIVLAEGTYGNEAIFANEMTRMVHSLGATKTTFKNVTGCPDPTHVTTARDLACLTQAMIQKYPDLYVEYFSPREYTYNNIRQRNHNALLYETGIRADGVKTGHTATGGYDMVGSSVAADGCRFIVVASGLKTRGERTRETLALLKWAENTYTTPQIFSKGSPVVDAQLWLGTAQHVALVSAQDLFLTVKRDEIKDIKVVLKYQEPLNAKSIKAGDRVGVAEVLLPDTSVAFVPLLVGHDVAPAAFTKRISAALHYIFFGHNG